MSYLDSRSINYNRKITEKTDKYHINIHIADTHVTGVDKPGDVSIRGQFSVHKAADFTVLPAVVDMDEGHHVPLQQQGADSHTRS